MFEVETGLTVIPANMQMCISILFRMAKTERLIEMVRNYPMLYDLTHEEYRNLRKKDKIWLEIGKELKENCEEVKKKWKNLRDTYAKYVKTNKAKPVKASKKTKKWLWANAMEPFRPFLTSTKTSSNFGDTDHAKHSEELTSEINIEFCKVENDSESTESVFNEIQPHPTASNDTNQRRHQPSSSVDMINTSEYDATDCLLLAHSKTIKTFSKKRQIITKMKLAEIIMEQELLQLEEDSLYPASATSD